MNKLDELCLVGKGRLQSKNDYKNAGIWCDLFLAPKLKYCLSIDECGILSEHKKFKGFSDVNRKVDGNEKFKLFGGEKLVTKQALSWKKRLGFGVLVPIK